MVSPSDRDKGLEMALKLVFPAVLDGIRLHHLSQNVKAKYSAHAASFTFKLARAKTRAAFQLIHSELEAHSAGAAPYLAATDYTRWARLACPYPRVGHLTSNIVESFNAVLSKTRLLPPLQMILTIWGYTMTTKFERKHRPQRGPLANTH